MAIFFKLEENVISDVNNKMWEIIFYFILKQQLTLRPASLTILNVLAPRERGFLWEEIRPSQC